MKCIVARISKAVFTSSLILHTNIHIVFVTIEQKKEDKIKLMRRIVK